MKKLYVMAISVFLFAHFLHAQSDSIEVYLIDAYVKPEPPNDLVISFYTSDSCYSKVVIDEKYEFDVSKEPSELHNLRVDISRLPFDGKTVFFVVKTKDRLGNEFTSETFDFDLPFEPQIKSGSSLWTLCLFAGMVFALPAPGYVKNINGENFSLTKEIPIISFRSSSKEFPGGYFAFEYTYIFNSSSSNFTRLGYKQIFPTPFLKYISVGLSGYTNFNSQNGIAPEVSLGLFTIVDTFTLYTRYRYNIKPSDSDSNFHEFNLGLYTRFFSLYL